MFRASSLPIIRSFLLTFDTGKFHAGFWWPLPSTVRMEMQFHPDCAWKRSITFSRKSSHLWDNVEKYGTAGQTTHDHIIWLMCIIHWITKATNTHSEYVTPIVFPSQQWLRGRAPMLCCTSIVCLAVQDFLDRAVCRSLWYTWEVVVGHSSQRFALEVIETSCEKVHTRLVFRIWGKGITVVRCTTDKMRDERRVGWSLCRKTSVNWRFRWCRVKSGWRGNMYHHHHHHHHDHDHHHHVVCSLPYRSISSSKASSPHSEI